MRVAGAQINLTVGDIAGNEVRIAEAMDWADAREADVLLLPELAVTGYPPEDLVLRPAFVEDNIQAVQRLAARSGRCTTVVGFVDRAQGHSRGGVDANLRQVANAAAILSEGEWKGTYHKLALPNYGVFDEDRYFVPGSQPALTWNMAGQTCGVSICEDIWLEEGPPLYQARAGARVLFNINGSPYHRGKAMEREVMLSDRAVAAGAPVVYLNLVGGQDELVFDGASVVIDGSGKLLHRSPQFEEHLFVVDLESGPGDIAPLLGADEEIYRALVTGLGDYTRKNGFRSVVIGLSGGIDSSLTAAIATDALGPESVIGVAMPTRYSSEHSIADAKDLAGRLGIRFEILPIDEVFQAYLETLQPLFGGSPHGVAEENVQARIRGAILMAISNKLGPMVIATGNKSETGVGYSTLYGDMVGGFAVLKDVLKTVVYRLARWRNQVSEVIPANSIDKAPSAELRPDQKDEDTLPAYHLLDSILVRYIEEDRAAEEIVAEGFDPEVVRRVVGMVDSNEYKRRQAAPGVKITTKAFGRDRRLPITNRYLS
jgi:NAD+ synthase (glutamine-hydrolysing)